MSIAPILLGLSFTSNEIRHGIDKLKKKSAGNDLILNEFIKTSSDVLLPVLTEVFYINLNNGKSWNLSVITPLYKSWDSNDTDNHGRLSVFTGLLLQRLNNHLENNFLICQYQFVFR